MLPNKLIKAVMTRFNPTQKVDSLQYYQGNKGPKLSVESRTQKKVVIVNTTNIYGLKRPDLSKYCVP